MATYLNSLSSHYTNLKRLIPTSSSPDTDLTVNDPNDSHVSRVLRAYYTEKGRLFPPWLGPDPNARQPTVTPAYAATPNTQGQSQTHPRRGLGDLFGESAESAASNNLGEPLSLRQRRPVERGGASGQGGSYDSLHSPRSNPPQRESSPQHHAVQPLPSQRLGSYQGRGGGSSDAGKPPSLIRAPSAQDRLKAKFGGGARSAASSSSTVPTISEFESSQTARTDPYGRGSSEASKPFVGLSAPRDSGNSGYGYQPDSRGTQGTRGGTRRY